MTLNTDHNNTNSDVIPFIIRLKKAGLFFSTQILGWAFWVIYLGYFLSLGWFGVTQPLGYWLGHFRLQLNQCTPPPPHPTPPQVSIVFVQLRIWLIISQMEEFKQEWPQEG